MRRTKEDAEMTRNKLLQIALKIFSAKGYNATRLDDIAKEAGLSRGAIYWHFKNKTELFRVLHKENLERSTKLLDKIWELKIPPAAKLKKLMTSFLIFLEEDEQYKLFRELTLFKMGIQPELHHELEEEHRYFEQHIKKLTALIKQGQLLGEFKKDIDPADMAISVSGFIFGLMNLWLFSRDTFSVKQKAESLVNIFLKGQLT